MISVLSTSEVWAMIFPLVAVWRPSKHLGYLKPVKLYLLFAFVLNVFCVAIDKYFYHVSESVWLKNNNYIYNLHSIIRFLCFCAFFERLNQPFLISVKKILPYIAAALIIVNFLFFDQFFKSQNISSNLFALEAGILLFYCLQYYLFRLQEDSIAKKTPDFWVTTGLAIYVVFNFPYFLFYTSLSSENQAFWWNIHNVSYIIFCIFIAKAFYVVENKR